MTKSRGIMALRRPWSEFELEVMRVHYATTPGRDLAELFGRPVGHVYAQAGRMGLCKAAEFQASSASGRILRGGRLSVATQFKPGSVPANKGTKRPGFAPGNMARTQFKPGSKPSTWRPVGTYVIHEGVLERKVADGTGPRHWYARALQRAWSAYREVMHKANEVAERVTDLKREEARLRAQVKRHQDKAGVVNTRRED